MNSHSVDVFPGPPPRPRVPRLTRQEIAQGLPLQPGHLGPVEPLQLELWRFRMLRWSVMYHGGSGVKVIPHRGVIRCED